MRKIAILTIILSLILIAGCAKQVQKEIPTTNTPTQEPVKNVTVEQTKPAKPITTPEEQTTIEPPKFVTNMNCTGGLFKFTINNIGEENLSITKVYMHIKAKLFFPTCDVMTLEPGKFVNCAQRYYSNIVGGAPVKIEAKIGRDVQTYIETVIC